MRLPPRRDLLFVLVQFGLLFALIFDPVTSRTGVPIWSVAVAILVCGAAIVFGSLAVYQLGSNLTPWPTPKAQAKLVTRGVYGISRHPIYTALLVFAIGLTVGTLSFWRLAITVLLYLLFRAKAQYEEGLLQTRFSGYTAYMKQVSRFGA